jgi:hypothetical protein
MFHDFFFENCGFYVIVWKYTADSGRLQITVWHMRNASWIYKATSTDSEYVIRIVFFYCNNGLRMHLNVRCIFYVFFSFL